MIQAQSRAGYFGIAPVLVACLFAVTLTVILWPHLSLREIYPEPVAGAITWNNLDKHQDIRALLVLFLTTAISAVSIAGLCLLVARGGPNSDAGRAVNELLLLSLVPACWRLVVACMSDTNRLPPLRFISCFPLEVVLALIILCRHRATLTPADITLSGGAILLAPVMAAFSTLGVLLTVGRFLPGAPQFMGPYVALATSMGAGLCVTAIVLISLSSNSPEMLGRRLLRLLILSQAAAPLLLFYLVPPPLMDQTHQLHDSFPVLLVCALGLLAGFSTARILRRLRVPDVPLCAALSPAVLVAIAVFVLCPTVDLPRISRDYFHSGEVLLPWQQLWDFHQIPYVDFAPIHGLMEIIRGAFNQLFFDGSIGTYPESDVLLSAIAVAATVLATVRLLSPIAALYLLLGVVPQMDRMYFVASPLFVISFPRLVDRPVYWLWIWLGMSVLLCTYNPAMGPAFALGTLPVALWQAVRAARRQFRSFSILLVITTVITGGVITCPLTHQMALGFARFILNNQWTNEQANGIAWSQGWHVRDHFTGIGSSQLLWEFFRFGWIPLVIGSAMVHWQQWGRPGTERSRSLMVLSLSIPMVLLFASPWVIGRIDPGVPSRSGILTQVALMSLLPALVFLAVRRRHAGVAALILAGLIGSINPNNNPAAIDPDFLILKPSSQRYVAAGTAILDGPAAGLPKLGQVIRPDPDFTGGIFQLKRDLSHWLKPGETFLDLSDESAFYYFLDMPCPVQYAECVAANSSLQNVMVRQVQRHPVPVVLIAPCVRFDGVPPSLRCYRLYHDFVLKFTAVSSGERIFLVDPAREPDAPPVGGEAELKLLDTAFKRENLLRLPVAWGQSWSSLSGRFDLVANLQSVQQFHADTWSWNIPAAITSGDSADFLLIDVRFSPIDPGGYQWALHHDPLLNRRSAEPECMLCWTAADGAMSPPVVFKVKAGKILVPLGAYPRWLLARQPRSISVTLRNPGAVAHFSMDNLTLVKLKV